MPGGMLHQFSAVAFVENISLKEVARAFPNAKLSPHELTLAPETGGEVWVYPFGALVFHGVPSDRREGTISRLKSIYPRLTAQVIREDFTVREDPAAGIGISEDMLTVET